MSTPSLRERLHSLTAPVIEWRPWILTDSWSSTMRSRQGTFVSLVALADERWCVSLSLREEFVADPRVIELVTVARSEVSRFEWPDRGPFLRSWPISSAAPFSRMFALGPSTAGGHALMSVMPDYKSFVVRCLAGWRCEFRDDDDDVDIQYSRNRCIESASLDRSPGPRIEWQARFENVATNRGWHRIDWRDLHRWLSEHDVGRGAARVRNWLGEEIRVRCTEGVLSISGDDATVGTEHVVERVWRHCLDDDAYRACPIPPAVHR